MKINFKPTVEMTNEEKETLRAFGIAFELACNDFSCEACPLHILHDNYNLSKKCPSFIQSVFSAFDID